MLERLGAGADLRRPGDDEPGSRPLLIVLGIDGNGHVTLSGAATGQWWHQNAAGEFEVSKPKGIKQAGYCGILWFASGQRILNQRHVTDEPSTIVGSQTSLMRGMKMIDWAFIAEPLTTIRSNFPVARSPSAFPWTTSQWCPHGVARGGDDQAVAPEADASSCLDQALLFRLIEHVDQCEHDVVWDFPLELR
jgi:hypothetical protein